MKFIRSANSKGTYILTTWQKFSPAMEQLHVTLFSTNFVTQLDLLLHGSKSKFQSLPSDLAITCRALPEYTIEGYQLSTQKTSKLQINAIKYL